MSNRMRDFMRICEAQFYAGTITAQYGKQAEKIVILKNPSRAEFLRLLRASKEKELRGLWSQSFLLVWDAYIASHSEIVRFLRDDVGDPHDGSDIFFTETNMRYNNAPDDFDERRIEQLGKLVRRSSVIKRLYPNIALIPLTIETDNGTIYHV